MKPPFDFYNLYSHGMIRVAVAVPILALGRPQENASRAAQIARRTAAEGAVITLYPELGLSGYSLADLHHQEAVIDASRDALLTFAEETADLPGLFIVGTSLASEGKLFNVAAVISKGQVLALIPKSYLPNYREFYEKRQFVAARDAVNTELLLDGRWVPFGNDLVLDATNVENLSLFVEICEDLWSPISPSVYGAMAGATVLANLSASNITTGKAGYRRDLVAAQSGKCIAGYLYVTSGFGESTTDLAWDGHAMVFENDDLLAESQRFQDQEEIIYADLDLERLARDRMAMTSFTDTVADHRDKVRSIRRIRFELPLPDARVSPQRDFDRFPYVPNDPTVLDQRCFETYQIQVQGLQKRLTATGIEKVIIGVSGGLDSTQALLVACRTMDRMELPRTNILGYTMPGFATSRRTLDQAHKLMKSLGVTSQEIDIRPAARQVLEDIGHPYIEDETSFDVTFENVQAGQRTAHLFRLANLRGGLVLGTGDLSELALGWTTYGVGDQMSHYNVNASVPKTLIQHLIRWCAGTDHFSDDTAAVLRAIVDTEISPELIPDAGNGGDKGDGRGPSQSTESVVGPYELQDFNLYYLSRFGFRPSKVAFMALHAWQDKNRGLWPSTLPKERHNEYDLDTIAHWLEIFIQRFFATSQFKRSAMPDGPKVGSGGSLSPRSDWRAPSDVSADVWLEELHRRVPSKAFNDK